MSLISMKHYARNNNRWGDDDNTYLILLGAFVLFLVLGVYCVIDGMVCK